MQVQFSFTATGHYTHLPVSLYIVLYLLLGIYFQLIMFWHYFIHCKKIADLNHLNMFECDKHCSSSCSQCARQHSNDETLDLLFK
jgi:hypothetical protein